MDKRALDDGMVLSPSGQWCRHDGFPEIFAYGANGLGYTHTCFGSLSGLDDGGGEEFVFDLKDFGQTGNLVCLQRGQSGSTRPT